MAAATAPPVNGLTKNFDKAREEYARAQEQMLATAAELDRLQKELQRSQQSVLERERAMMEAAVKDGVTATTATAAMVALNPAAAAKVRAMRGVAVTRRRDRLTVVVSLDRAGRRRSNRDWENRRCGGARVEAASDRWWHRKRHCGASPAMDSCFF
jgi:hypothetical protein